MHYPNDVILIFRLKANNSCQLSTSQVYVLPARFLTILQLEIVSKITEA
jgi:hypothetical protein